MAQRLVRIGVCTALVGALMVLSDPPAGASTQGPLVYGVNPFDNTASYFVENAFSPDPEHFGGLGLQPFSAADGANAEGGSVVTIAAGAEAGLEVGGLNGLAIHPLTSTAYAVLGRVDTFDSRVRFLATIDLTNGEATTLGRIKNEDTELDIQVAGITFSPLGVLYAVSGDGSASCRACLFTLDETNGEATHLKNLGTSNQEGEAIAFNPDDGMIYHASGTRSSLIFEKLDPGNGFEPTNIVLSTDQIDQITGIGYDPDALAFVAVDLDRKLWSIEPDGTATQTGETAVWHRGVAVVPDPVDPVAADDYVVVPRNSGMVEIDVRANDIDGTGGPVGVIDSIMQPANGTAQRLNANTAVGYDPDQDYCNSQPGVQPDVFTYTLDTGSTGRIVATVACPVGLREVTLRYKVRTRKFIGTLTSTLLACAGAGVQVNIFRQKSTGSEFVRTVLTNDDGRFSLKKRARGKYFAIAFANVLPNTANCRNGMSPTIRVK